MVLKPYIQGVEDCIDEVAREFQKLAFNFNSESDLQAYLYSCLRAKEKTRVPSPDGDIELVHAEFPVFWENNKVERRYDLVVWEPRNAKHYPRYWEEGRLDQARHITVLVAIEIKYLYGGSSKEIKHAMEPFSSYANLMKHNDIKKLTKGANENGYFLIFLDEDIKKKKEYQDYFKKMKESFEKVVKHAGLKLRVLFISRDGCGFKLGFSRKGLI